MNALRLALAVLTGMVLSLAYDDGGLARLIPQASRLLSTPSAASQFSTFATLPYRNCAAARAAGAAPVYRGDPGYAPWLDRDSDGIGCEWAR